MTLPWQVPAQPRVALLGDSWIRGLGPERRRAFGKQTAAAVGASAVLDLCAISRTAPDIARDHLGTLREFGPDLAVVAVGGADSLVFPAPFVQRLVDRFAPPTWHGVEGLMVPLRQARDRRAQRRQKLETFAKVVLKQVLVRVFGGHRRVAEDEFVAAASAILDGLDDMGCAAVVVGFGPVDGWLSPGTNASVRSTNAALRVLCSERPRTVYVDPQPLLTRYQDYLADHVHLGPTGHAAVTEGVLDALREQAGRSGHDVPSASVVDPDRRPRVLHLAYEDPRAPGAGGGSVRTREIDSRLAARFDIDVVSVRFPGAAAYRENGVRYRYLGSNRGGRFLRQLSYFAALPAFVRRYGKDYDLVVEDFGAPFSSVGIPRWTDTPCVGVVQWLFAREKATEYHLPFHRVERFGVRQHSRLVAVSADIGARARALNPGVQVDVVANGLPDDALSAPMPSAPRADVLYLGRLDIEHKGLDLLLEAFDGVHADIPQDLVIGGDGPGEQWLRTEVARRGLDHRVRFLGRVAEADRFDVLGRHELVVMPSRYESFGMIAAEAAAVGTPVLAFDIACLRDLVPSGLRVPPFDVAAFATSLRRLALDPDERVRWAAPLRDSVRDLSWDRLADAQARVYDDVLGVAARLDLAAA